MVSSKVKNLKGSRRTRDVLSSSVVECVCRRLVLTISERLERRLDESGHLGLVLDQKVRNSYVGERVLTFHPSDVRT